MSITNTQTKYFTSGQIKFSAIRDTFGDLAGTDVRASDYARNAGDDIDWEASGQTKTISPRVPNATENADIATLSSPVSISENVNVTDTQGSIVIGNFNAGTITVTRYNDGVTGTEGHAVGSIGYFVDVSNVENLNLSVTVLDTATRGSGLTASDNSIALSTGYPQTITSKRFKVAFDMTNSQGPGRQATYARSFQLSISGDDGGINDWKTSQLRDSIVEYNVTQDAGTNDEELEFADTNVPTWNDNLSKNVKKKFSVEGTIYANEVDKYALTFSEGEYNNLTIHVPDGGKIYGEGGAAGGGNGGGALYVRNMVSNRTVSITLGTNGQIWAGGGGGGNGNNGNSGSTLSCFTNSSHNSSYGFSHHRWYDDSEAITACRANAPSGSYDVFVATAVPTSVRSRCRGGTFRAGQGWNSVNKQGYSCSPNWSLGCTSKIANNIAGGNGGNAGNGGVGQGFSNQSGPGSGNSGNPGNTNTCAATGANSSGNSGNSGGAGGTWGVAGSSGGSAGFSILRRFANINQGFSINTIKGTIANM